MQCPVLTYGVWRYQICTTLLSSKTLASNTTYGSRVLVSPYAISGTDIAHHPMPAYATATRSPVLTLRITLPGRASQKLLPCYALRCPGTLSACAMCCWY
eukprot:1307856-Rhodomonas_salina.2